MKKTVCFCVLAGLMALGAQADLPSQLPLNFGWNEADFVPADYDGDGKTDLAVYYPMTGSWFVWSSQTGEQNTQNWGWSDAKAMPADFDGDGKADFCVFYPETGSWFILQSSDGQGVIRNWGWGDTWAVPYDFSGNGKADLAVYYPENGSWYIEPFRYAEETDRDVLWQMYSNAIPDSHTPTAAKIWYDLVAITPENENLIWENGKVCMTMFTDWGDYTNSIGQNYETGGRYNWVTASTQFKAFCQSYRGSDLKMRICQYLGLPPYRDDGRQYYVVEFMVDPLNMFRPSRDAEITDRQAELNFRPDTPFQTTPQSHRDWIEWNVNNNTCPWTSLGYTYDWSEPTDSNIGASEFIINTGSTVYVRAVYPVEEYSTAP